MLARIKLHSVHLRVFVATRLSSLQCLLHPTVSTYDAFQLGRVL
jgi:hypothetical protein